MLFSSVQFSSVSQSCPTLWDPMDLSTPGLPVHHQLPGFTQTHVHWVSDAIQPSHPPSSPFLLAFNLSQHQGLFKWVSSSHQVEFQLQHQSFQWIFRTVKYMANKQGKKWKQWQTLFSWAPKVLWTEAAATKLKDTWSLEEKLWQT